MASAVFLLAAAVLGATAPAEVAATTCHPTHGQTWFVQAGADPSTATGTRRHPFASLAAVEAASGECDTIFVRHAPATTPSLDGGITLEDGQRLIGTGPDPTRASASAARAKVTNSIGDAVILANDNVVLNLHIDSPGGSAITGFNVDGSQIQRVLVTDANRLAQVFDASLCDPVGQTTVVACDFIAFLGIPGLPTTGPKSAIVFGNDDAGPAHARHSVVDSVVSGVATSAGLAAAVAGDAQLDVRVSGSRFTDSFWGVVGVVYQQGNLDLRVHDTDVEDTISDGSAVVTGFVGSAAGLAPPSDGSVYVEFDGYRFRGSDTVNLGGTQTGFEIFSSDSLAFDAHIIMRNSDIIGAHIAGVQVAQDGGFGPAVIRDLTVDLGCVDMDDPATPTVETCEHVGLRSGGGRNRIVGNGPELWGDVQLFGPGAVVAQGNWWGSPDGLGDCVEVLPPFDVPGDACTLFDNGAGVGTVDARFPLAREPRWARW